MTHDKVSARAIVDDFQDGYTSHKLCLSIMDYIDANVYTIKRLHHIADVFGYNYCHLSTVFKKNVGITLASYYRYRRLTEAKLLLEENKRVGEVAHMLNYSSMYSFSKAFKKYWGVSPKPYTQTKNSNSIF